MSRRNCSYISSWLTVFFLGPLAGFSQSSLLGKITDRETGEPVPYANVFFSHTTMGSATLEDGTFIIRNIPNGKFDLMVFVVGYKRFIKSLEFQDSHYKLDIALRQDTINLETVTVHADQADKKFYPSFEKYFLGQTKNAKECKIMNPETLHFYFDRKLNTLFVHGSDPLVVENEALGYTLHNILDRFELDFMTGHLVVKGIPRFEEIPFVSRKDSTSRVKKRKVAYHGSLNHFMRSLYANSLASQGFRVFIADSVKLLIYRGTNEKIIPFNTAEHMKGSLVKLFYYQGLLKVEYEKESESWPYVYSSYHSHQISFIRFKNSSLTLYENGYYMDQLGIFLDGYLAWDETACNLLPLGYNIPVKQKRK